MARNIAEALLGGLAGGANFLGQTLLPYLEGKYQRKEDERRFSINQGNIDRVFNRGVYEFDTNRADQANRWNSEFGLQRDKFSFDKSVTNQRLFSDLVNDSFNRSNTKRMTDYQIQHGNDSLGLARDEFAYRKEADEKYRRNPNEWWKNGGVANTLIQAAAEQYLANLKDGEQPDYNVLASIPNMIFNGGQAAPPHPSDTSSTPQGAPQTMPQKFGISQKAGSNGIMSHPYYLALLKRGYTHDQIVKALTKQ